MVLTMANQKKVVYDLSNGAICNDHERPYPQFQDHAVLCHWIYHKDNFNEILIAAYTRPT